MKTTATNRKVRELVTALREGRLQPRPEFQRRLVWTNKDKIRFLETVLMNLPFPEIYVAAGDVDLETGVGTEMLVDGQQRITTLNQYFLGAPELRLGPSILPYAQLDQAQKEQFLQYDVVVRDLGKLEIAKIREVFERINATSYSLNAMEIHNARFEGAFKRVAEELAQRPFFDVHRIFSAGEIRRMQDTRFLLTVLVTVMSTYFNRDDEIESFLEKYNDEFEQEEEVRNEIDRTLAFIESCNLPEKTRAWKRADLFTLIVEIHRLIEKQKQELVPEETSGRLVRFYEMVDSFDATHETQRFVADYYKAALQATNDRSNRITRGRILNLILRGKEDQYTPKVDE